MTPLLVLFWGHKAPLLSLWGVNGTLPSPSWRSVGLPWLHLGLSRHPSGCSMELQSGPPLRKDTSQSVGSSTLRHSQSATLLLWGDLCRPFSFHIGLRSTPAALLGATSALLGRGRCQFGVDKWLLQKKVHFLEKVLPQAAKLPGTSSSFKKYAFKKKVLP